MFDLFLHRLYHTENKPKAKVYLQDLKMRGGRTHRVMYKGQVIFDSAFFFIVSCGCDNALFKNFDSFFNARYGLVMIPAIAFFVGVLGHFGTTS